MRDSLQRMAPSETELRSVRNSIPFPVYYRDDAAPPLFMENDFRWPRRSGSTDGGAGSFVVARRRDYGELPWTRDRADEFSRRDRDHRPGFSLRVGPGIRPFVLGPKRYLRPALLPKDIPAPGAIVLSHAHYDHLDTASLKKFSRETPIVTAKATGDLSRRLGFRTVHELDWGQSAEIKPLHGGGTIRFTALEVAHWGARMMRDEHRGFNG